MEINSLPIGLNTLLPTRPGDDAARLARLERLFRWASATEQIGRVGADRGESVFENVLAAVQANIGRPGSRVPGQGSATDDLGLATRKSQPAGRDDFGSLIRGAAQRHGVDEGLVRAVIQVESGFKTNAVSPAGAKGLMQLMDGTARALGVTDSFDPAQNIDGGVRFLRSMLDRFGSIQLALAAYNAGPGAVQRFGGIPPYAETQAYVTRVMGAWHG